MGRGVTEARFSLIACFFDLLAWTPRKGYQGYAIFHRQCSMSVFSKCSSFIAVLQHNYVVGNSLILGLRVVVNKQVVSNSCHFKTVLKKQLTIRDPYIVVLVGKLAVPLQGLSSLQIRIPAPKSIRDLLRTKASRGLSQHSLLTRLQLLFSLMDNYLVIWKHYKSYL